MANYGTPIESKPEPSKLAVLRTVALGFNQGVESTQLPPGMTSRSTNWLDVNGALIPRPGTDWLGPVAGSGSVASMLSQGPLWVGEGSTGTGGRIPLALSYKFPIIYNGTSWSTLSQVGAAGLSGNTLHSLLASTKRFDATRYYHPVSDEFEVCFATSAASAGVFTWRPRTAVFSTLTNSPAAGLVCAFDNRLMFSRITSGGTFYPQRVQWSARGDPETYTAPDGGFEELMDSGGVITRLWAETDRVLVFFDQEVWVGIKYAFPFNFQFLKLDQTVGCSTPSSIARTPKGTVFLGNDLNLYLIPRGGTPQRFTGDSVKRLLLDTMRYVEWEDPDTAPVYGIYDETLNGYLLLYDNRAFVTGGPATTGVLTRGVFVNMDTGIASPIDLANGVLSGVNRTGFVARCVGETYLPTSSVTAIQRQRILLGTSYLGAGIAEWASTRSCDALETDTNGTLSYGTASVVALSRDVYIPNPNPTERIHLRELRVDYRAGSDASVTLSLAGEFNESTAASYALALPAASPSAQSRVGCAINGVSPYIQITSSGFTNLAIQGLTAIVESMGNG